MPHHAGARSRPSGHSGRPRPARLAVPAHPRLEVVTADVLDPASITPAVDGADAVLTAVAPPGTGPSTLRQDSTRSIIQAMQKFLDRGLRMVRPAGEFTAAQASPVAAQDVASHSPLQRLTARCRRTATPAASTSSRCTAATLPRQNASRSRT